MCRVHADHHFHGSLAVPRIARGRAEKRPGQRELFSGQSVLGVHDAVAVALLRKKPLAVRREIGVYCVASNHGVETRGHAF
jgi:hypothetical protein